MSDTSTALAAMATGGKRQKVHNAQAVIKLPSTVKELVNSIAAEREVSDSVVWREAMAEYLTRRGYNR